MRAKPPFHKASDKADKLTKSADAAKDDWEGKMLVAIDE
jgi:hypothetical protein